MRTMIIAAATALSLSAGAAYADGGDSVAANSYFTQLPGVVAQAPEQGPAVATAQNGRVIRVYVTNSNHGTWLFGPDSNQGANS